MLLTLLCWVVYGLVVGTVAKWLHPGPDPKGFLPTIGIGIAGSYVGGLLSWLLFGVGGPLHPAGLVFGIIGGVICCFLYHKYLEK
jgi:uncharacterized membrane protein YeaQ/YmgE (transglycosylase-associated protein family)